jgi:RNA polymerase sigma-70 factor (ECF subfamily)
MTTAQVKANPKLTAGLRALLDRRALFLTFLERRVGSREQAEELLQESYARAISRLDTLRADPSAVAWFYRLLRNAVVDARRRNMTRNRALATLAAQPEPDRSREAERERNVCPCMMALVEKLKPEYRQALQAVEIDGRELGAFAAHTGITANNAAVRIHRARQALGRRVRATCGACATNGCLDCTC